LIASVPGYHTGTNLKKWGHMKLRTVLQECTFDKEFKKSPLVYQVYLKFFLTGMMIMWQLMVEFDAKGFLLVKKSNDISCYLIMFSSFGFSVLCCSGPSLFINTFLLNFLCA
jgi:hypothetical protein